MGKIFNPDNYDIADMRSDDSTDDDSRPKKTIPSWARSKPSWLFPLRFIYKFNLCVCVFQVLILKEYWHTKRKNWLTRTRYSPRKHFLRIPIWMKFSKLSVHDSTSALPAPYGRPRQQTSCRLTQSGRTFISIDSIIPFDIFTYKFYALLALLSLKYMESGWFSTWNMEFIQWFWLNLSDFHRKKADTITNLPVLNLKKRNFWV